MLLVVTGCASNDDEEREPAEVTLYNLSQDRMQEILLERLSHSPE